MNPPQKTNWTSRGKMLRNIGKCTGIFRSSLKRKFSASQSSQAVPDASSSLLLLFLGDEKRYRGRTADLNVSPTGRHWLCQCFSKISEPQFWEVVIISSQKHTERNHFPTLAKPVPPSRVHSWFKLEAPAWATLTLIEKVEFPLFICQSGYSNSNF